MRKEVFLLLFLLFSTSYSLTIYHFNCTDGIAVLNGTFYSENAYTINGTTFVKCGNLTLFSDLYGPVASNSSIFDYFGYNLSNHSKYLYLFLNHTGNFSISNYTFEYNGTHLLCCNLSIPTSHLLQITFSNQTFSLLNRTFPFANDTINTTTFLSFSFSRLSNTSVVDRSLFNSSLTGISNNKMKIMITYPIGVSNPEKLFFIISSHTINATGVYDEFSDGISFIDCNQNITEIDTRNKLIENESHFIVITPVDFGSYIMAYDDSYCSPSGTPNYQWYQVVDVENPFGGLEYEVVNDSLWILNPGLENGTEKIFDSLIFDLSGMKDKYEIKLNSLNPMIMCKNTTCLKSNISVNSSFKFNSNLTNYVFKKFSFNFNVTQRVYSRYFEIDLTPRTTVSSPDCNLTFNLSNNTVFVRSSKDFVTCGICVNYSYLNRTGETCKDVTIDEPILNITKDGTKYNYTIESISIPTIWVFKSGRLVYTKEGTVGEFEADGNLTIIYGNKAGNKTYAIIVPPQNPVSSPTSTSTTNSQSGISTPTIVPNVENVSQQEVNESDINISNRSLNKTKLNPVVFGITGRYIDVNNDLKPLIYSPLLLIPIIIFLILKYLPKIERRIIE